MTATRLVWVKEGDHVNECHRICQQCATDTGDDHAGEPDVELLRIRDEVFTIVEAEGDWWEEYMTVHGWHGWPLDLWLDVFDWIPDHVGELRDFLRKLRTEKGCLPAAQGPLQ